MDSEASQDRFSKLYTSISLDCGFIVPTFSEKVQRKCESVLGHCYGLFMLCASPHKTDNLQFWLTIYGIIPTAECLSYVNDGTNDPHDWMLDGSGVKSGEDITVTCNSGYVQILGLNIRDFCDLAENALVSVCMRKYTMHHKLN